MKKLKELWSAFVAASLLFLAGLGFSAPLLAQIPTGVPADVQASFDASNALIVAIGVATLVVIYSISGLKWPRAFS